MQLFYGETQLLRYYRKLAKLVTRLAKLVTRLQQSRPVVILGSNYVYKIYPQKIAYLAERALSAANAFEMEPFKSMNPVLQRSVVNLYFVQIHVQKKVRKSYAFNKKAQKFRENFVLDAVRRIPRDSPLCPWHKSLETVVINKLLPALRLEVREFIEHEMCGVMLPVTGCHGDFGASNLVFDSDDVPYLIDWDCYRANGSFIQDACRAFVMINLSNIKATGGGKDLVKAVALFLNNAGNLEKVTGLNRVQLAIIWALNHYLVRSTSLHLDTFDVKRVDQFSALCLTLQSAKASGVGH